jgi:uncharacterized protein YndB with AHSA1/START domain
MIIEDDRLGSVTRDGDRFDLAYVRRIAKPIEQVWAAITTPERIADWFTTVELEPRLGGLYRIIFEGGYAMDGEITAFDPPRRFAHTWPDPAHPDSVVRYEPEPDGDGCVLRFSQTAVGRADLDCMGGWHIFLDAIPGAIEGRRHGWTRVAEDQILKLYRDRLAAVGVVL